MSKKIVHLVLIVAIPIVAILGFHYFDNYEPPAKDRSSYYEEGYDEYVEEQYEEHKWDDPDAYIQSINPDAIPWDEAYEHIGEYVTLYGDVTTVDTESADGNPIFIDIGGEYPDERLTGVIFEEYHSEFPGIESIVGEPVFIEGKLTDYNGTPSIKLTDGDQLSVIE